MRVAIVLIAGSLVLAACGIPRGAAYNPNPLPPAPRAETIPKPPVTEELLIWQPGHWDWTGTGYAWAPGKYVAREGHGSLWLDGHWVTSGTGWAWVPGGWV